MRMMPSLVPSHNMYQGLECDYLHKNGQWNEKGVNVAVERWCGAIDMAISGCVVGALVVLWLWVH
jgi:hypothetical protein